MNFSFVEPWHLFLPREPGHVIGISGSGGKTSLLLALAAQYRTEGIPTILTTTTRSEVLADVTAVDWNDPNRLEKTANEEMFYLHAGVEQDKWQGLLPEQVDELEAEYPDRVILVETDGAGMKPLKWYRSGEPVWPRRTSLAAVVMNLGALEEKAQEVVYRFERESFAPLADLGAEDRWTWDHTLALLTEEGGYLNRVPAGVPAVVALTGMSEVGDSIGLFEFMSKLMADPRAPLALFCELSGTEPSLRAVCRRTDEDDEDEAE